jgi:hypothetical protein
MIVCLSIKQEAYQLSSFAAALGCPRECSACSRPGEEHLDAYGHRG